VDPHDVKILSVREVSARRMLKFLTVATKLNVDFQVDVTEMVAENEKAKPYLTEEAITEEVVAEVSTVINGDDLVEDFIEATGVTTMSVEVTVEPVTDIIDMEIKMKEDSEVHNQAGAREWKHLVICTPDNMEDCVPKRSKNREFEMPSGFGGTKDSEFSDDPRASSIFVGVNPMTNASGKNTVGRPNDNKRAYTFTDNAEALKDFKNPTTTIDRNTRLI